MSRNRWLPWTCWFAAVAVATWEAWRLYGLVQPRVFICFGAGMPLVGGDGRG